MLADNEINTHKTASEYNENGYKIMCGGVYRIAVQRFNNYVFYKIPVNKHVDVDGKRGISTAYKQVKFVNKLLNTDEITDGCCIRPLKLFEDFYFRTNDRFNPIWTLIITDWEVIRTDEQNMNDAIYEFNQNLHSNNDDEDFPF